MRLRYGNIRWPTRDPVNLLIATSVGLVVALWATKGQSAVLPTTAADALISAGRLSGLIAADLLLVAVLLMARIPPVERALGRDELTRRHRLVAIWSFGLLWFHVGVSISGYAARAGTDLAAMTWELSTTFPGMLLALAATAALTLVAATSGRAARRRLRYESWHLLHLYSYLGAGLAIPHQIWLGGDFVGSPAARLFWVSAWAASATAIIWFRLVLPLGRSLRHRMRVVGVRGESQDVVSLALAGRDLSRLGAQPGQYLVWRFLDGPGWSRGHPYSLSAAPSADQLRITIKSVGPDSARLGELRPGTRVMIEGPYGRVTPRRWTGGKVLMIAAGIGIAPLLALLEDLPYEKGEAILLYRAGDESEVVLRDEILDLEIFRGLQVHFLLGPRKAGQPSWLPAAVDAKSDVERLLELVPDLPERDVFVCGPEPWADAVCRAAVAAGVAERRVHRERFSW